jgi:hypothetical protein
VEPRKDGLETAADLETNETNRCPADIIPKRTPPRKVVLDERPHSARGACAWAGRPYKRLGLIVVDRRAVVPHATIHATGEALLMTAPV